LQKKEREKKKLGEIGGKRLKRGTRWVGDEWRIPWLRGKGKDKPSRKKKRERGRGGTVSLGLERNKDSGVVGVWGVGGLPGRKGLSKTARRPAGIPKQKGTGGAKTKKGKNQSKIGGKPGFNQTGVGKQRKELVRDRQWHERHTMTGAKEKKRRDVL